MKEPDKFKKESSGKKQSTWLYDFGGTGRYGIEIKPGQDSDETWLEISYYFKINQQDVKKDLLTFSLFNEMSVQTLKALRFNVDTLNNWAKSSFLHSAMLRLFIRDALSILDGDELLQPCREFFILSLLEFLDNAPTETIQRVDAGTCRSFVANCFAYAVDEQQKFSPKFKMQVAAAYLRLCRDDRAQSWFDGPFQWLPDKKGKSREQEVKLIVDVLLRPETGKLQGKENDVADLRHSLLHQAHDWLLTRYNLSQAARIMFRGSTTRSKVFLRAPETLTVLVVTLVFIRFYRHDWGLLLREVFNFPGWPLAQLLSIHSLSLFFVGLLLFPKLSGIHLFNTRIFLPRLAAGITVGYFLLLTTDMLGGALSVHLLGGNSRPGLFWFSLFKIAAPLAAVYLYMFSEIKNVPGVGKVGLKTLTMLGRGYVYAIAIGALILELFGRTVISSVMKTLQETNPFSVWYFDGIAGIIYPEVLLFHAPLALFTGVFLQLLWDDKKLTDAV